MLFNMVKELCSFNPFLINHEFKDKQGQFQIFKLFIYKEEVMIMSSLCEVLQDFSFLYLLQIIWHNGKIAIENEHKSSPAPSPSQLQNMQFYWRWTEISVFCTNPIQVCFLRILLNPIDCGLWFYIAKLSNGICLKIQWTERVI